MRLRYRKGSYFYKSLIVADTPLTVSRYYCIIITGDSQVRREELEFVSIAIFLGTLWSLAWNLAFTALAILCLSLLLVLARFGHNCLKTKDITSIEGQWVILASQSLRHSSTWAITRLTQDLTSGFWNQLARLTELQSAIPCADQQIASTWSRSRISYYSFY